MTVTFKNVLDRTYTTLFTDFKLDKLYKIDTLSFYEFLSNFLVNSVDMFNGALTDLSYHLEDGSNGEENYIFDNSLTSKEVYILSLGVAIGWYKKYLDDVTQFELHLTSKDFKAYSEANNLQRRLERINRMEEELSYEITQYQLNNFSSLPFFGG